MLVYGITSANRVVHISEVQSGHACGCHCPECGETLIAHKGLDLAHHFHHASGIECATAPETALHRLAKQIVVQVLTLRLPQYTARIGDHEECIQESRICSFDAARVEVAMENIVADVVASKHGIDLVVEIAVTHRCETSKVDELHRLSVAALEIDLSHLSYDAEPDVVRRAVGDTAPRLWLNHPKGDAKARTLIARWERERAEQERWEEAARQQAAQEREIREARRLEWTKAKAHFIARDLVARVPAKFPHPHVIDNALAKAYYYGLTQFIGHRIAGDICFVARPEEWQALILDRFVLFTERRGGSEFPTDWVMKTLREEGCIASCCVGRINAEIEHAVAVLMGEFHSPFSVTLSYLRYLKSAGLLRKHGKRRWTPTFSIGQRDTRSSEHSAWTAV